MRRLLALLRVLRAVLHVVHGVWVMAVKFPKLDSAGRHEAIRWWSAGVVHAMGVRLDVRGTPHAGATLLAANHVSWLDIAAIHAAVPHARFVSKADVLAWPVLGWLISGAGTLFIEREKKRDALRVVHAMAEALSSGHTVAIFPEGTTGEGPELLPFHANLLQAAITTGSAVQPLVLRFSDEQQAFSPAVVYIGDTTLSQSLWRIAMARHLTVHIELLPALSTVGSDRRALSAELRRVINDRLPPAGVVSVASVGSAAPQQPADQPLAMPDGAAGVDASAPR